MTADPTVGFIGLGLMGGPMATNLARAGLAPRVWNRSPDKAAPVTAAGAVACDSKAELAAGCQAVFLCVFDTDAVEEVLFGDDGIAAALPAGAVVVDHSTIAPAAAIDFAARLREAHDVGFVDAPITGGVPGAEAGTLVVFGGGDEADVERVRPLVMHMAARFEHMGTSGTGQYTKMCNQLVTQVTAVTLAEMMKLAEATGIGGARAIEVLRGGTADSFLMQLIGERMAARSDEVRAPLRVVLKDLDLVQAAGKSASVAMPMAGLATELVRLAEAKGMRELDLSQIVRIYD